MLDRFNNRRRNSEREIHHLRARCQQFAEDRDAMALQIQSLKGEASARYGQGYLKGLEAGKLIATLKSKVQRSSS